jgi:predicted house-cleaning noncanonical NTP pyrophosphatase (MazG superfamily)
MKEHNMLVRDNIPDMIRGRGGVAKVRKLNVAEYKKALLDRLVKEAEEVQHATDKLEFIVELADVEEVLRTIIETYKIDRSELTRARNQKRKEKGGFQKRFFLEDVSQG